MHPNMVVNYSNSSILGLAAVGDIQAANVLMGPFKIVIFGLGMITIPEAAHVLRRSPRRLPLFCLAISGGLALAGLAWGAVLLVVMPLGLGQLVLGSIWRPAYPLVLPTTLAIAGGCAAVGAAVGMHALGASRRSLRAAMWNAGITVAAGIVGALLAGVLGTLYFTAAAAWLTTVMSWWYFRKAMRESSAVPVPGWLGPGSGRRHATADTQEERVQTAARAER